MPIWEIALLALAVAAAVVLTVFTAGAALAGVTVLGVTFAAGGASAGTLIAVGIGAFGGALAGGMAADKAGGDVMLGILLGGIIGGATALIGGAIGGAVVTAMKSCATWLAYGISGAIQGAISGFGSGLATGWAGGKGSLGTMMLSALRGMIWGSTLGLALGVATGALFANASGQHNYLEFFTLHKEGLGFGANTTGMPGAALVTASGESIGMDVSLAAKHIGEGAFGFADVGSAASEFMNMGRDVGRDLGDLGFFTTKIPGTLFAIDANAIASAIASNGAGGALVSVSIGADAAGFSYAQQIVMILKMVPFAGPLVALFDDVKWFDDPKKWVNTFYGSSNSG
jgi:hypothetical protein